MKIFFRMLPVLLVTSGCANHQYAGINYGDVTLPSGERWVIVGGKDETNVTFEATRVDGTTARYYAESANASAVLAEMARIQAQQLQILSTLLSRTQTP